MQALLAAQDLFLYSALPLGTHKLNIFLLRCVWTEYWLRIRNHLRNILWKPSVIDISSDVLHIDLLFWFSESFIIATTIRFIITSIVQKHGLAIKLRSGWLEALFWILVLGQMCIYHIWIFYKCDKRIFEYLFLIFWCNIRLIVVQIVLLSLKLYVHWLYTK